MNIVLLNELHHQANELKGFNFSGLRILLIFVSILEPEINS